MNAPIGDRRESGSLAMLQICHQQDSRLVIWPNIRGFESN